MTWRDYLAGASGATLGFIGGDIPGAVVGGKLGYSLSKHGFTGTAKNVGSHAVKSYTGVEIGKGRGKLSKNTSMQVDRSRSRSRGRTASRAPLTPSTGAKRVRVHDYRSYSRSRSKSASRSVSRARSSSRKRMEPHQYKAGTKTLPAKSVRIKKKKKVKISRRLKTAILQTVSTKRPVGKYMMKYANSGFAQSAFSKNTQAVFSGGDYGYYDCPWDFTVDHYVNAASILFNGAFGTGANANFNQPNQAGRFAQHNLMINVKKSSLDYTFANKTLRSIYIRVFEVAPKMEQSFYQTDTTRRINDDGSAYTFVANDDALTTPKSEWTKASVSDDNLNARSTSNAGGAVYDPVPIDRVGNLPTKSPSFMQKFKCAEIKQIRLEPGQFSHFKVNGPGDIKIDMGKYTHDTTYYNVQKFSRGFIFIAQLDTVAMEAASVHSGFARAPGPASAGGLLIEKRIVFKMEAPDATTEGNMKNVVVEDIYDATSTGVATEQTDENVSKL